MRIGLVLPGLSQRMLDAAADGVPVLRRVLRRARRARPVGGHARALCELCGLPSAPAPVAALTAGIDFPEDPHPHWLRADPVYLHADLNDVLLFQPDDFEAGDVRPAFDALAEYFRGEGVTLRSSADGRRWYLRLAAAFEPTTVPLDEVAGGSITGALPSGASQARWRRVMTETQMLLHDAARAGPRVNALWLWGEGAVPESSPPRWDAAIGDDVLLAAIARRQGIAQASAFDPDKHLQASTLIVDRGLQAAARQDEAAVQAGLARIEATYLEPLFDRVRRGAVLELLGDDGAYRLTRGRSWRLWR